MEGLEKKVCVCLNDSEYVYGSRKRLEPINVYRMRFYFVFGWISIFVEIVDKGSSGLAKP